MSEAVLASAITGALALIGSFTATYMQNNKTKALILYRLNEIEKKQDKHNSVIERTYILEEKMKMANHRIDNLEGVIKHV